MDFNLSSLKSFSIFYRKKKRKKKKNKKKKALSTGAERKDSYIVIRLQRHWFILPVYFDTKLSFLVNQSFIYSCRSTNRWSIFLFTPPLLPSLVILDSFFSLSFSLLLIILRAFSLSCFARNRRGKNSASNKRVTLKILFFSFFPSPVSSKEKHPCKICSLLFVLSRNYFPRE